MKYYLCPRHGRITQMQTNPSDVSFSAGGQTPTHHGSRNCKKCGSSVHPSYCFLCHEPIERLTEIKGQLYCICDNHLQEYRDGRRMFTTPEGTTILFPDDTGGEGHDKCPMCGRISVLKKPVGIIKMVSKGGVGFKRTIYKCEANCGEFIMEAE